MVMLVNETTDFILYILLNNWLLYRINLPSATSKNIHFIDLLHREPRGIVLHLLIRC